MTHHPSSDRRPPGSAFISDVPAAQAFQAWQSACAAAGCPQRVPGVRVPVADAVAAIFAWVGLDSPTARVFRLVSQSAVLTGMQRLKSSVLRPFPTKDVRSPDGWTIDIFLGASVVDVRVSNGRLLPFATIPICVPDERPPYRAVMHGPTLESSNTTKAVGILLGKAHPRYWGDIAISGSDAPLRPR